MSRVEITNKLKEIFEFEFNNNLYGIENSEYTDEIINVEIKRLSKRISRLNQNRPAVLIKCNKN
ncbi:MAG: hypothetical protein IJ593_12100, partial [Lachnospiraceae bacterium]|nr:hypothetical protein [Lachnospiraceae bacterium]